MRAPSYTAEEQGAAVRARQVRIVSGLFPLSPAAASFTEAAGSAEEVPTFHLYTLRSMLRRERQYLGASKRHAVEGVIAKVDAELKRRNRLSQM